MSNIKGLEELQKKLDALSSEATYAKALGQAALIVEVDAVRRVPVDTGLLRQSLHTQVDKSKLIATVGTPLSYAPYVEFGTGIHSSTGMGRSTPWSYQDEKGVWHTTLGQRPQPYLGPALIQNRDKIQKQFEKAISKEISK